MASNADSSVQLHCHYHTDRPAFVRCGGCNKPLCAECVYHGPVGTRCVECLYGIAIQPLSKARRVLAGAAAFAAAVLVGSALGYVGWLNWLTGIILGLIVGHVGRTVARRVPAPSVQAAAGVAGATGAYCGALAGQIRLLAEAGAPVAQSVARAATHVSLAQWWAAGLLAAGVAIYWVWRG